MHSVLFCNPFKPDMLVNNIVLGKKLKRLLITNQWNAATDIMWYSKRQKVKISYFLYTTGIKLNMLSNIKKNETLIITNNREQYQWCSLIRVVLRPLLVYTLIFIGVIVRFNGFASWFSFKLSFQFVDTELVNHIEPPPLSELLSDSTASLPGSPLSSISSSLTPNWSIT